MPLIQCPEPGCRNLVKRGRCVEHSRELRGGSTERGYDATWQRLRRQVLARDRFICQECKRQGRLTGLDMSSPVDHIQPLRLRPDLRLVESNLEALCTFCHDAKTKSGR